MVNLPAFVSVPTFGSSASKTQPPGGTYAGGYLPGQVFPSEHENWFMAGLTGNGVASNTAVYATVEEIDNYLTAVGTTPASGTTTQLGTAINSPAGLGISAMGMTVDYTDWYQLDRHIIARSFPVGVTFHSDVPLTQVIVSASRSSSHPSYPDYCPAISRSVDKTITTAMAPLLVPLYRTYAASFLGVSSFAVTVSGSNVTFSVTSTTSAMMAVVIAEAFVRRWFSSGQSASYAASGGNYTGMTINVAGTDYPIVSINSGTGVFVVTGSPSTGAQTAILYPYRISGSITSVQLPRLSGFVPVASNDADGIVVDGYRSMDTLQGHLQGSPGGSGFTVYNQAGGLQVSGGSTSTFSTVTGGVSDDVTYGAARPNKNTSPRTWSQEFYTWAGDLEATA